ncbi:integral membrane protein [Streptomyces zinciresistens K42]|uniref:Integral membrane protein n=1 Tax=Streptomyces zinciresistens K42 TaxID=700597 RepID=G2GPR0_9ACTN|nr:hypothetical protein [Streptomyces zinciresistens]EGX54506.1 integral membrane protein [Streptomyces zinciresistens K42]
MSGDDPSTARERGAPARTRADYTGGVYGSMLAASVVIGVAAQASYSRAELVLLLLLTGLVFWAAHVHAQLFGARLAQHPLNRATVLHVLREEWPIVKAAVPPALAAAVSPLFGLDLSGTAWLALSVAVAGQVGWSVAAAARAGATRRLLLLSATVNLLLGLLIILVKLVITH